MVDAAAAGFAGWMHSEPVPGACTFDTVSFSLPYTCRGHFRGQLTCMGNKTKLSQRWKLAKELLRRRETLNGKLSVGTRNQKYNVYAVLKRTQRQRFSSTGHISFLFCTPLSLGEHCKWDEGKKFAVAGQSFQLPLWKVFPECHKECF